MIKRWAKERDWSKSCKGQKKRRFVIIFENDVKYKIYLKANKSIMMTRYQIKVIKI